MNLMIYLELGQLLQWILRLKLVSQKLHEQAIALGDWPKTLGSSSVFFLLFAQI